ncbi:MAG: hypothetical protein KUG68_04610 [Flavobacteriaceae bacterium]|nr:hypothetical protein [Flavobacteriaceae bacterium]
MNGTQLENKMEDINITALEHLMFEVNNGEHIVNLVDHEGYIITRGYGNTIIEAINDMHHNLI